MKIVFLRDDFLLGFFIYYYYYFEIVSSRDDFSLFKFFIFYNRILKIVYWKDDFFFLQFFLKFINRLLKRRIFTYNLFSLSNFDKTMVILELIFLGNLGIIF